MVSLFLQKRCAYPALCENHDGSGALLLTPRLDAQTSFAKLVADLATEEDVRRADLATLLLAHPHQRWSLPGTSRRWNLSLGSVPLALCITFPDATCHALRLTLRRRRLLRDEGQVLVPDGSSVYSKVTESQAHCF